MSIWDRFSSVCSLVSSYSLCSMDVCLCTYVRLCVCVRACMGVCMRGCVQAWVRACMGGCVHVWVCACVGVCMRGRVQGRCMCRCMSVVIRAKYF